MLRYEINYYSSLNLADFYFDLACRLRSSCLPSRRILLLPSDRTSVCVGWARQCISPQLSTPASLMAFVSLVTWTWMSRRVFVKLFNRWIRITNVNSALINNLRDTITGPLYHWRELGKIHSRLRAPCFWWGCEVLWKSERNCTNVSLQYERPILLPTNWRRTPCLSYATVRGEQDGKVSAHLVFLKKNMFSFIISV